MPKYSQAFEDWFAADYDTEKQLFLGRPLDTPEAIKHALWTAYDVGSAVGYGEGKDEESERQKQVREE